MTIIIVTGLSSKISLLVLVKRLAKVINGNFEALAFANVTYKTKDCYLRLSPNLDVEQVIENINQKNFGCSQLEAYIPDHVPEHVLSSKPRQMPKKMRRKLHIPVEGIPTGVLQMTHQNILAEMQYKYPGLAQLIKKTDYKLHKALSTIVHERLLKILQTNTDAREKCFNLSKYYRRSHPHFADFQLILSTLRDVERARGSPHSEVSEEALSAMPDKLKSIKTNAVETVKGAVGTCSKMIIDQVINHISQLDATPATDDTEEDVIRKQVRKELKSLSPYVPDMLKQVITNHFVPRRSSLIKIHWNLYNSNVKGNAKHYELMSFPLNKKLKLQRISLQPFPLWKMYGEPFLPNQEVTRPFLKSYRALNVVRSDYMYNLIRFEIAPPNYENLMAADGMLLDCGAKLLIRPASLPICRNKPKSGASTGQYQKDDDAMEEDVGEDY